MYDGHLKHRFSIVEFKHSESIEASAARCHMTKKAISRRTFLGRSVVSVVGAGIGISGVAGNLDAQSPDEKTDQPATSPKDKPQIKDQWSGNVL